MPVTPLKMFEPPTMFANARETGSERSPECGEISTAVLPRQTRIVTRNSLSFNPAFTVTWVSGLAGCGVIVSVTRYSEPSLQRTFRLVGWPGAGGSAAQVRCWRCSTGPAAAGREILSLRMTASAARSAICSA